MRRAAPLLAFFPFLAWGQGPIETRNHAPAALAFLRLDPRGPLLAPRERSFSAVFSSANSLRIDGTVREDNETQRLSLRLAWGVERGEWRLEVPVLSRGGGFQDSLIDAYHRLLGIGEFRGTVEYGRSEERLGASGAFGSATGLGDMVGTFSRPLGPQAFASVALKLPTGDADRLFGSGALDAGVAVGARWKLNDRFRAHAQAGLVVQGKPTRLERARRMVDQESLALEVVPNSRDAYVLQWQSEPAPIRTGRRFTDGVHRQLTLGWNRRLSSREGLQAFCSEDGDFLNFDVPELANVAPDFTFGVRWTRRF